MKPRTSNGNLLFKAVIHIGEFPVPIITSHHYIVAIRWIQVPQCNEKNHDEVKCSWE